MNYVILGAAGFILMHLMDLASLKRLGQLKPVLSVSGTTAIVAAMFLVTVYGSRFNVPAGLQVAGWMLFALALSAMIHSLYFALPFGKTYLGEGCGRLVTGGVYRLVRHPWLLFFTLAMIGLVLGSRSILALQAAVVWTALSAAMVYIQDTTVFPRMFPGYAEYRKHTPMLLPSIKSMSAFIEGMNQNKVSEV